MADGIFISYRREDSSHAAGRLQSILAERIPRDKIFMDVDGIGLGHDFHEVLDQRLDACNTLLVMMGPGWINARDENGLRRLEAEDDFVRHEVRTALRRSSRRKPLRVVPILLDDAQLPEAEDLPEDMHGLLRRQGLKINHESFERDARRLLDDLSPPPESNFGTGTGTGGTGTGTNGITSIFPSKKTNSVFAAVAAIGVIGGATATDFATLELFTALLTLTFWAYVGTLAVRFYLMRKAKS